VNSKKKSEIQFKLQININVLTINFSYVTIYLITCQNI